MGDEHPIWEDSVASKAKGKRMQSLRKAKEITYMKGKRKKAYL